MTIVSSGCGKKEEPVVREVIRPVKIMTVTSGVEAVSAEYPGRVRASQRVDLAFQVSGPLIQLPVEEGQVVKKGQLIARILPRDFKTDLDKARAHLRPSSSISVTGISTSRNRSPRRISISTRPSGT